MSLLQLPHELQLQIFEHLADDYSSLTSAVLVSRQLYDCAFEVLKTYRTLDLSDGVTDEIEAVLGGLYLLAWRNEPAPRVEFKTTDSELGDNIIRHASRYNTLKVDFDHRRGRVRDAAKADIDRTDIVKFEKMMRMLAYGDGYDVRTFRRNFSSRMADTSLRLVFHTMRHLTTLELGGSTNVLPWDLRNILQRLRTLKFTAIINKQLSGRCCDLAARPGLLALEFSNMSITSGFLGNFKYVLSIKVLRFTHCWVEPISMTRVIEACKNLETFEYSLSSRYWKAEHIYSKHHHLYRALRHLRRHTATLKHLTLVIPDVTTRIWQCNHIGSLAVFSSLETLTVSHNLLAAHHRGCNVDDLDKDQVDDGADAFSILAKLPPSVQRLSLHLCEEQSVLNTLSGTANAMGLADVLPNLRQVEAALAWTKSNTVVRHVSKREQAVLAELNNRGIKVRITRR